MRRVCLKNGKLVSREAVVQAAKRSGFYTDCREATDELVDADSHGRINGYSGRRQLPSKTSFGWGPLNCVKS